MVLYGALSVQASGDILIGCASLGLFRLKVWNHDGFAGCAPLPSAASLPMLSMPWQVQKRRAVCIDRGAVTTWQNLEAMTEKRIH